MSAPRTLTLSDEKLLSVKIHPTAVLSILNSYMRRTDKNQRVIGTLLGNVKDEIVEITDCFGFPHQEIIVDGKISVSLDVQMSQAMFSFHRRINKNEQIVGWYATTTHDGVFITEFSSLINQFYKDQCKNPVHIVVDTTLSNLIMAPKGYICTPMSVDAHVLATVFQEITVEIAYSAAEQTCLHHMIKDTITPAGSDSCDMIATIPTEKATINKSFTSLNKLLDEIQVYVDKVVEGTLPPSREIGVALYEALARLETGEGPGIAQLVQERTQIVAVC